MPIPTATELKQLAREITDLTMELNNARLIGYLDAALKQQG